jgi:hypothetical protein
MQTQFCSKSAMGVLYQMDGFRITDPMETVAQPGIYFRGVHISLLFVLSSHPPFSSLSLPLLLRIPLPLPDPHASLLFPCALDAPPPCQTRPFTTNGDVRRGRCSLHGRVKRGRPFKWGFGDFSEKIWQIQYGRRGA